MKSRLGFLILILAVHFVLAQPMTTDRPDQTKSALTILKGRLQVETGLSLEKDQYSDQGLTTEIQTWPFATTLFRYGLTRRMEISLGSQFRNQDTLIAGKKSSVKGLAGLTIGTKIRVFTQQGNFPDAAVIISAELPVGEESFVGDKIKPTFIFAAEHELNRRLRFAYNLGGFWPEAKYFNLLFSGSLGINLADQLNAFIELYGDVPRKNKTNILFDLGLALLLQRNIEVDFSGGMAINEEAPDQFFSFGFSFRLPK